MKKVASTKKQKTKTGLRPVERVVTAHFNLSISDLKIIAEYVDRDYDNNYISTGEFEAICEKCFKNTIATSHKKNCPYGIADSILKKINAR